MNYIRILAIDPGSNTGIAIYTIDSFTFNIVSIETDIVVLNNQDDHMLVNSKIANRLRYLNFIVKRIVLQYDIDVLVLESAFVNRRFPKAVVQLSQYIATIELSIMEINKKIKMFRYPPLYIKKQLSVRNTSKDAMSVAVGKVKEITDKINISLLTEHEVDAIAIGYTMLKELRLRPYYLIAL